MIKYNLNWLRKKGFFEKSVPLEFEGKEVLVDENNLLAYVEASNNEEVEKIRRYLTTHKVKYMWFFFPDEGRVKVFRKSGEVKWFYYSPRMKMEYLKSKTDKLNSFSTSSMNILFDIKDVVEKFYWQLWEYRKSMAESIKELKKDENKLLAAQHFIDRLIFFYFISQLKLVKIKNENQEWTLDRRHTREFFEWICSKHNEIELQEFLNKMFFDVLGKVKASGWGTEEFDIAGEKFSVVAPCLDGGLFVERKIEGIPERQIRIRGIKKLILEVLNNYNWIIGEESPEEEDVIGDLTPEIIGHIYEKFVVSLEQIGIGKLNLKDLQTAKETLRYGRKKIGAYYTPEEITNYISVNTIYPYIKDTLKEKFGEKGVILFKKLFEKEDFSKSDLEIIKYLYFGVLAKIKICDNACGSGSFLIAAGEVLLRLYNRVLEILEKTSSEDKDVKRILEDVRTSPSRNYYLVRQIIVNNLYGVDIMDGAVEIAKLRFWLWLVSQIRPEEIERQKLETLPNLDFNLMVGNSLVGFVDIENIIYDYAQVKRKARWENLTQLQSLLTTWNNVEKREWLENLAKEKQKFKILPAHKAVKLKERLSGELEQARDFLNERFYILLRSRGIKISREEFQKLKPFHWGFEFYEVFDLEKPKEERGFDVLIGNPPYVDYRSISAIERAILNMFFVSTKVPEKWSLYVPYVERSLKKLNNLGKFCFIMPQKWLCSDMGSELRNFILNNFSFHEIVDLLHTDRPVFQGQTYSNLGLFFIKNKDEETNMIIKYNVKDYSNLSNFHGVQVDVNEILFEIGGKNIIVLPLAEKEVREVIEASMKDSELLKKIVKLEWGTSASYGNKTTKHHKKKFIPLIQTSDIKRYSINWLGLYIPKSFYSPRRIRLFKKEKIVATRRSPRLRVAIDKDGFALGKVAFSVNEPEISLEYLTVILNSSLIDFLFKKIFESLHPGGSFQFDIPYLNLLPIKISQDYQKPFEILCNYMLLLRKNKNQGKIEKELIRYLDQQIIDSSVCELYFREEFRKDGMETSLVELLEPYLRSLSSLKSDWQKVETIRNIITKIKTDKRIMRQLKRIKLHPWVRIVEGKQKSLH